MSCTEEQHSPKLQSNESCNPSQVKPGENILYSIYKILISISGTSIGQNVVISMAGIAKVFAGEIIEEALDYMESLGESGPLKPKHLREAHRRVRNKQNLPY